MSKFKNVFPAKAEVKKALADFTAAWGSDYLKVDDENSKQVAIARAMKAQEKIARSGIPKRYRWCTFQAIAERGVPDKLAENFAVAKAYALDLDNQLQAGHGLLMTGPCGQLKTTMACAIALTAIKKHKSVFFVSMPELLMRLLQDPQDGSFLAKVRDRDIVILDDLGMEYQSKKSDWMKGQVDAIITHRYNELKPTIITTNLDADQIIKRYDTRFFDRLRDSCYAVISGGDSVRGTLNTETDQKTGEVKYVTELNAQVVSLPIGLGKQAAGAPPPDQHPCGAAGFSQFGSPEPQQPRFPDDPPF